MTLMQRRRALMAESVDPTLLYSLENYRFTDFTLGTNTPFLSNGHSRTLAIDIQIDQNPTTSNSNGSFYKLARSWGSGGSVNFSIGKSSATSSNVKFTALGKQTESAGATAATGRKRIILTHDADSNIITIYTKMDAGTLKTSTLTGTYAASGNILIGGDGGNMIKSGLINKYQIYDRILTQKEINAFFA